MLTFTVVRAAYTMNQNEINLAEMKYRELEKLLEVEEAIKSQAMEHVERGKRQILAVLAVGLIGGLIEGLEGSTIYTPWYISFSFITIKVIVGVILTYLIICVLNQYRQNRKVAGFDEIE